MNLLLGNKSNAKLTTSRTQRERQNVLMQEFGHLMAHVAKDLTTDSGAHTVGFCASKSGEGCSSIAANYALLSGQQGIRTTLIETNMRRPSLAKYFDVDGEGPGLAEILEKLVGCFDELFLPAGRG